MPWDSSTGVPRAALHLLKVLYCDNAVWFEWRGLKLRTPLKRTSALPWVSRDPDAAAVKGGAGCSSSWQHSIAAMSNMVCVHACVFACMHACLSLCVCVRDLLHILSKPQGPDHVRQGWSPLKEGPKRPLPAVGKMKPVSLETT